MIKTTIYAILNLGDVLERGTHPKEVLSKLNSLEKNYPIISVMGNHDEAFLYNRKVSGSSLESISAHESLTLSDLSFFHMNSDKSFGAQQFVDQKNNLFCVHGGPLDPQKITPKNAGSEAWLYQRNWQRLSKEEFEFLSYSGYHYIPSSAFDEVKNIFKNFLILCGHQHEEAVLKQNGNEIKDIYTTTQVYTEKLSSHVLEKREFTMEPSCNYLVRVGLGGPEGYYGFGITQPHFGIIQHDEKKVILFCIKEF